MDRRLSWLGLSTIAAVLGISCVATAPGDEDGDDDDVVSISQEAKGPKGGGSDGGIAVCHIPPGNPANAHTIIVGSAAVSAHLAHGDSLGACGSSGTGGSGGSTGTGTGGNTGGDTGTGGNTGGDTGTGGNNTGGDTGTGGNNTGGDTGTGGGTGGVGGIGGGDGGTGGTTTTGGTGGSGGSTATCTGLGIGGFCTSSEECCSGTCADGACVNADACVAVDSGAACSPAAPCCGDAHCVTDGTNGVCYPSADLTCVVPGGPCDPFNDFCCWDLSCGGDGHCH